jgi:hypothetical protein
VVKRSFMDKRIVKSSMAAVDQTKPKLLGRVINDFGQNPEIMNPGPTINNRTTAAFAFDRIDHPLRLGIPRQVYGLSQSIIKAP